MLADAEGDARVSINGAESRASDQTNETLPPGTIVTTGEEGKTVIELLPGFVIELQPNSQLTIGEVIDSDQVDPAGNPIPQVSITVTVGTVVVVSTPAALETGALQIVTPRGNIAVVESGQTVVTVTGADPTTSTVTVASPAGSQMVSTTQGEQIPVAEGLAVILTPEGQNNVLPVAALPSAPQIAEAAQSATSRIGGLNNLTPVAPAPVVNPPAPNIPTILPVPSPTPTPVPSPSPRNTPV